MKTKALILSILLLLPLAGTGAMAQTVTVSEGETKIYHYENATTSTEGQRYEIVRLPDTGRPAFRLDKVTGQVWYILVGINSKYQVLEHDPSELDIAEDGQINYQLLVDSATHAVLLNLNTGIMWEYYTALLAKNERFKLMEER